MIEGMARNVSANEVINAKIISYMNLIFGRSNINHKTLNKKLKVDIDYFDSLITKPKEDKSFQKPGYDLDTTVGSLIRIGNKSPRGAKHIAIR